MVHSGESGFVVVWQASFGWFRRVMASYGLSRSGTAGKVSQVTDWRVVLRNGRLEEKEG